MTAGHVAVVTVDPRVDRRWRELVSGDAGSLFTSPGWIAAVCDTYGFTPQAKIALGADGEPVAGAAWVRVDDLRGPRSLALPFCDRADPIVDDLSTWDALTGSLFDDPGVPVTVRALDGTVVADDPRFERTGEAAWHGTPLGASVDELHARLSSHARRNISVGRRNGARLEVRADVEAIRTFHSLHVQLRKRKYGLLAQPRELFDRIWAAFAPTDAIRTVLAYDGDTAIAGSVYIVWNDVLYYKFGASLAEHLALRPNELITWEAMQFGIERGLRLLDWGLSDLDQPGLVTYKRKWASDESRIGTYRAIVPTSDGAPSLASNAASSAAQHDAGRLLGNLTDLLVDPRVPDDVSERAGALLYRYFC
jgi:CelD/BcsL family acetyltransferase involved in cellulose biosynthesis